MRRSSAVFALVPLMVAVPYAHAALSSVAEGEPNDTMALATTFVAGDTLTGRIAARDDVDYFRVELQPNDVIELDATFDSVGSTEDPELIVLDEAGTEIAGRFYLWPTRVTAPVVGTYYVRIRSRNVSEKPDFTYRITSRTLPHGSGDPTTVTPMEGGGTWSFATAGPSGQVFFGDADVWVHDGGPARRFARLGRLLEDATIDAFGDLLVTSFSYGENGKYEGFAIHRVDMDGDTSAFALGCCGGTITVGPNGDVYAPHGAELHRYDPFGWNHVVYDLGRFANVIGFAPDSTLLLHDDSLIYRWTENGGLVETFSSPDHIIRGAAIDSRGYLYVHLGPSGIALLDDDFTIVEDPFAITNVPPFGQGPFFLRASDGSASSDLALLASLSIGHGFFPNQTYLLGIATEVPGAPAPRLIRAPRGPIADAMMAAGYSFQLTADGGPGTWTLDDGELPPGLELSDDGVISGVPADTGTYTFIARIDRDASWGGSVRSITVTEPAVRLESAADHLMLPGALDPVQTGFLDARGNADGDYDLADFHRLAIERGVVQTTETEAGPSNGAVQ